MRILALSFLAALCLMLGSCSKEHGDLIDTLPVNPEITSLTFHGVPVDSVALAWDYADDDAVDEYRIYMGMYISLGGGIDDTLCLGSTSARSFGYKDAGLGVEDEDFCDFGLCDPAYTYTYFRVSAVINGVEGTPGWREYAAP